MWVVIGVGKIMWLLLLGREFECKVVVFRGDACGGWCWFLVVMLVVAGAGFW
jgi:hypothetical protein